MEQYYTVLEISKALKVTPQAVYKWIKQDLLKADEPAGCVRVSEAEYKKFLHKKKTEKV